MNTQIVGNVLGGLTNGLSSGMGPVGAILGGGLGLIQGIAAKNEAERQKKRAQIMQNSQQAYFKTEALRSDIENNQQSYRLPAVKNGGEVGIQAMVAPGEVVVTENGEVVHIKGSGNKDTVAWTGGPATVFGNLKRPGSGEKYKDFAKRVFKETKPGVKEAEGNVGARMAAVKQLTIEQENEQMKQNKTTKYVKPPKNISSKNIAKVPAAYDGLPVGEMTDNLLGNYEMGFWDYAIPIAGSLAQSIPAIYNLSQASKGYEKVDPRYNPFFSQGLGQFKNNYDLAGGIRDDQEVLSNTLYDISTHGNTLGVSNLYRLNAQLNSLENRRKLRKEYSLAQDEIDAKKANFLYNEGAARVQADNYAEQLTAQNKAAQQQMAAAGWSQLATVIGNAFKTGSGLLRDYRLTKAAKPAPTQTTSTQTTPITTNVVVKKPSSIKVTRQ